MMPSMNFPADSTPLSVELFEEADCNGESYTFNFRKGLLSGDPKGDSVLNYAATAMYKLVLPFNHIKKGYSPLINYLPDLKCNGSDCLTMPSLSVERYLPVSADFREVILPFNSCGSKTFTGSGLTANGCMERNGRAYVMLKTTAACNTSCTLTITDPQDGPSTLTISSNPDTGRVRDLNENVFRLFGSQWTSDFFELFQHEDGRYGLAGRAQEVLSPGGAVSLFGRTPCTDLAGIKEIEVWDEGAYRRFQVEAKNSTKSIPTVLCDTNNPNTDMCTSALGTFHKKISLRSLENQIWKTREVLHVRCDSKIGYAESQQEKMDGSELRSEKNIIGWNTDSTTHKRIEVLDYEKKSTSNTVTQLRTSFSRAEILTNGDFRGVRYNWNSHNNSGLFNEQLSLNDFYSESSGGYQYVTNRTNSFSANSTSVDSLLTQPVYTQVMNRPYLTHDSYTATSPNGSKVARVWVQSYMDDKKVYLSYYDKVSDTWYHPVSLSDAISTTEGSSSPRVAINDDGRMVIAWANLDGGYNSVVMRSGTFGSLSMEETLTANGDTLSGLNICMQGSKASVIWAQTYGPGAVVRAAYSNNSTTWTKPTTAADFISPSGSGATNPKCAISSAGKIYFSWVLNNSDSIFTSGMITDAMSVLMASVSANTFTDASLPTPTEIFLETSGDWLYATAYNSSSATHIRKKNMTDATAWSNPYGGNAPSPFRAELNQGARWKTINSIGATAADPAQAPSPELEIPYYGTVTKGNPFGLRELKPSAVEGKFTPYANFVQQ